MKHTCSVFAVMITIVLLTTMTSVQALKFAFKMGIPTKVVVKETCSLNGGLFVALNATLSDATGHTETIDISKAYVGKWGKMYDYCTTYCNCLDGTKIKIDDRHQQFDIFKQLLEHLDQQQAQTKNKK